MPTRFGKFIDQVARAGIHPNEGVVIGFSGFPVPDHGGFALVGNADGGNIMRLEFGIDAGQRNDFEGIFPDFFGIMFHPAGLGINLLVFFLGHRNDGSLAVKYNAAGTGSALVDSGNVGHGFRLFPKVQT